MAKLADLLTDPTARLALANHDMKTVYRILRDAGVRQWCIAEATGQRASEISDIICGRRQVRSIVVLRGIADGLGVPRSWMGLAYTTDLEAEQAAPEPVVTEEERRSTLLRQATGLLFGKPESDAPGPIPVQPEPTPVPRRSGPADVEQVKTTTQRLVQRVGDLGGIPMTDALTAHTRTSEALLGAAMGEPVRQELLIALSDAHRLAGCAAVGAGQRDLGRQHRVRGMDCAAAAGDLLRAMVSLVSLGSLELHIAPNEALKLFQLSVVTAPSPLPRAFAEYQCARAYGLLGLETEAVAALRRAGDTYEAARDEPRPWQHFAVALPHLEGCTYLALGRFDPARAAFTAAIDGMGHSIGCVVDNLGHLAAAQLRSGEVRLGLQTAERVVDLAKGLRSVLVQDSLAPLQQAAAARRDSACQDLAREVATLRRVA